MARSERKFEKKVPAAAHGMPATSDKKTANLVLNVFEHTGVISEHLCNFQDLSGIFSNCSSKSKIQRTALEKLRSKEKQKTNAVEKFLIKEARSRAISATESSSEESVESEYRNFYPQLLVQTSGSGSARSYEVSRNQLQESLAFESHESIDERSRYSDSEENIGQHKRQIKKPRKYSPSLSESPDPEGKLGVTTFTRKVCPVASTMMSSLLEKHHRSGSEISENFCAVYEENTGALPSVQEKYPTPQSYSQEYFQAQTSRCITSNSSIQKLPHLDHSDVCSITKKTDIHRKEKNFMFNEHCKNFQRWIFSMTQGYNILVYGVGSKQKLLSEFACNMLRNKFPYLEVNGFFPGLTLKNMMLAISDQALSCKDFSASPQEHVQLIRDFLCANKIHFFLIIHNIDGQALRHSKIQDILSQLAACENCHVIASIDHLNAALLWDPVKAARFSWLFHNCNTYSPYQMEAVYETKSLFFKEKHSALALSSVQSVYHSLTPNAQKIFLLLVRAHLKHKKDTTYLGMAFGECYHKSREAFLVNSDLTLRAQLTEFKDHKLLKIRKSADGGELLSLTVHAETLENFLCCIDGSE